MRSFLFLLLTVFSSSSFAATYLIRTDDDVCSYFVSAALTCAAVTLGYNKCSANAGQGITITGCSVATVAVGTTLTRSIGGRTVKVTAIPAQPTCAAGTHLVESTNTCVSDVLTCVPSMRTIDPCPSGYAPSVSSYSQSDPTTQYSNPLDGVAIQEILYAIGMAVCAAVGIGVGVKLV